MEENIAILRRDLSLAIAGGRIAQTLRKLKAMPIETLEALSASESKAADKQGLSTSQIQDLEAGLKKLDFYVCGILMHRILEEK